MNVSIKSNKMEQRQNGMNSLDVDNLNVNVPKVKFSVSESHESKNVV